jgi:hypothetical protein
MRFEPGSINIAAACGNLPTRSARGGGLQADWDVIPEPLQLRLTATAMRRAAASIASQADGLAHAMETGLLEERDGPEALRLLAAVLRITTQDGRAGALPA